MACDYPAGAGAVLDRRAGRARGRGRAPVRRGRRGSARETRRVRASRVAASADGAGRDLEGAASPRSRPWAGSAPPTSSRTASCPGPRCPRCWRGSTGCSEEFGIRVANVFHAGDGNLHPLVLFDDAVPGEGERAEDRQWTDPRPVHRARRLDHRRTRRRRRQVPIHAENVHRRGPRHHAARPLRLRSRGPVQPGQGLPDAEAVRRGSRGPQGRRIPVESGRRSSSDEPHCAHDASCAQDRA